MPAILSVGIDIGTSTTQVVFSRIVMENTAGYFSAPQISIIEKSVVYQSVAHATPLKTPVLLDGGAVRELVKKEFARAGYRPADVDTGAVIITGESARKENASLVLEKLSGFAGEFVVSTAGPDLESIIAGKGSGAFQYSVDNDCRVVNMDIGGGTTNLVCFHGGEVEGTGCFDIGGRLIRLGPDYTVESVSPPAQRVAREVKVPLQPGRRTTEPELTKITDRMAQLLAQAVGLAPQEPLLWELQTAGSSRLKDGNGPVSLCFSGGVADCIHGPGDETPLRFGDIGVLLGRSIRNSALWRECRLVKARETIRATVVGAGTYTTSLSGSTIAYSPGVFPLKNVPVLKLTRQEQRSCLESGAEALFRRVKWFLEQGDASRLLLALPGEADPSYERLRRLAECVAEAMDRALAPGEPVLLAVEDDIAKALGGIILELLGERRKVVSIDRVKIENNDFIDIGRPLMEGMVVPVVVKTLLFG